MTPLKSGLPVILSAIVLSMTACKGMSSKQDPINTSPVRFVTEDAERFAELYTRHGNALTAEQLQSGYLDAGTQGVVIFTPNRIHSAENLAYTVANDPALYQRAIKVCLPAAQNAGPELAKIYQKYSDLLDSPEMPKAYAVIGADNSGGTAADGAFVIGLEVICRLTDGDEQDVSTWLNRFFAHETAHVFQSHSRTPSLLAGVLREGGADFIAELVSGGTLNEDTARWYHNNKTKVLNRFETDMASLTGNEYGLWLYAGEDDRPAGWPMDLGYVIGAEIARSHYAKASDKKQAIKEILSAELNPEKFLRDSGYLETISKE